MFSKLFKKITANIPAYLDEQYSDDPIYPGYVVENNGCKYHVLATFPSRTGMKLVVVSSLNTDCENAYMTMNAGAAQVVSESLYSVGGLICDSVSGNNGVIRTHPMIVTDRVRNPNSEGPITARSLLNGSVWVYTEEDFDMLEAIQDPFILKAFTDGEKVFVNADIPAAGSEFTKVIRIVKTFWGLDGKERVVALDSINEDPTKDGFTILYAERVRG